MTFLFCVVPGELVAVRQKGDAELCAVSQDGVGAVISGAGRTRTGLWRERRQVSYTRCHVAWSGLRGHEPTWTISWVGMSANGGVNCRGHGRVFTCCCFFEAMVRGCKQDGLEGPPPSGRRWSSRPRGHMRPCISLAPSAASTCSRLLSSGSSAPHALRTRLPITPHHPHR